MNKRKSVLIGLIGPICVLIMLLAPDICAAQKVDKDTQKMVDSLNSLYRAYKVEAAYRYADSIVSNTKNLGPKLAATCACTITNYAEGLWLSNPDEADRQYTRAMRLAESSKYAPTVLFVGASYVFFCTKDKRYSRAQEIGEKVCPCIDSADSLEPALVAEFYNTLSLTYRDISEYKTALKYLYKSFDATYSVDDITCGEKAMNACCQIISTYRKMGYDEAEETHYRSLYTSLYNKYKGDDTSVSSLIIKSRYYLRESVFSELDKDYKSALAYQDSATATYGKLLDIRKPDLPPSAKRMQMNLFDLPSRIPYLMDIRDTVAVDTIARFVKRDMADIKSDQIAEICEALGYAYLYNRNNPNKAHDIMRFGYRSAENKNHTFSTEAYDLLYWMMESDLGSSDYSDKDWLLTTIDSVRSRIYNTDTNIASIMYYRTRGWMEYFGGNKPGLELYTTKAANILNAMVRSNFGYLNAEEFSNYWSLTNNVCSNTLQAALVMGSDISDNFARLVYKTQLAQKNINFVSQDRIKRIAKLSPELAEDYNQLIRLKHKLYGDNMDATSSEACYSKIREYEKKLMKYVDTNIINILDVDFDKIKRNLKDGEIAVEFSLVFNNIHPLKLSHPELCKYDYVAIVFSNKSAAPKIIPIFTQSELNNFRLGNGQKLSDVLSERLPDGVKALYSDTNFTDFVWKKVLSGFQDVKKIYFSPTGSLYSIALENLSRGSGQTMSDLYKMERVSTTANVLARFKDFKFDNVSLFGGINYDDELPTQESVAKHYVGAENYTERFCLRVRNAAMAVNAVNNASITRRGPDGTVFKPLASTFEECDFVVKMASDRNVRFFNGDSAVEESFRYCSKTKPYVIHIASHGYFDPESASDGDMLMNSGLVFAGVNNYLEGKHIPRTLDDGFLTSAEISELDLSDTRLAVLSACETGLGIVNSDGLFGLERGFKLAGVESVLMSLWSISDEATSLFMRKFYGALIKGSTPREALHIAQEYLRQGNRFSHPYYWAGFVIVD